MTKGRPTKYDPKYIDKVKEYLEITIDVEDEIVKQRGDKGYEIYEHKLRANLPTMDGFARFIGVPRRCLYDWRDKYEDFSHSLDEIVTEQQERLINMGLSGDYNPTIAKLILSSNHGMSEKTETDVTSKGEKLTISDTQYEEALRAATKRITNKTDSKE